VYPLGGENDGPNGRSCDCDEYSNVRLLEPVHLPAARRALVMILEERPVAGVPESALLSEAALAEDWNRPEEDEAWLHLQQVQ